MPNYTREELAKKTALTNQMRNNLYHFLRYFISKGLSNQEIRDRLERMGKNIATTILENMTFQGTNLEELFSTIYLDIFESKVSISHNRNYVMIEDKKCSLCRYKRENLEVSPCIVIASLVKEICSVNGHKIKECDVTNSVALGDLSCMHSYEITRSEE